MNLHDFIMNGLSELRSNAKYCKADVMFLALGFLQRGLLDENDAEEIAKWYKKID